MVKEIMRANEINKSLIELQGKWYGALPDEYKNYGEVSSPFCLGVSEETAREVREGRPLLMLVGEEPRNWWFNYGSHHHESDLEYLQGYAIAYYEKQVYGLTREVGGHDYYKEYSGGRNPFARKNTSMFWSFIKRLHERYAIVWNNLDKLHRIKDGKTVLISEAEERLLHSIKPDGKTLLLGEIDLVKPDRVIFLGKAYKTSIECGLMLRDGLVETPELEIDKTVVEIRTDIADKVLWMCHPASLNRRGRGLFMPTVERVLELLEM